ncbi:integrase, catalytic region, zinc finger, CCHC-type containing protein [Tanacetum coccineum]
MNVVKTNDYVANVDVKNAIQAKIDILCVSYEKNVLIPCHDKCLAKYKLFINSNVRRALFTTPKTAKTKSVDTAPVVAKTRFVIGLGHNHFSVGQFCDGDLEVAFRSKTCYVRNLEGYDLLTGKRKKATLQPKLVTSTHYKLELKHMDLCGSVRVESINGKKYILVIVNDYSRYTWVYFLHIKDEAPDMIMKFITQVQLNFTVQILKVRSDNGTKFKNAILKSHYENLSIMHQFSIARTDQQNGVVERHNRTLVEVARTMFIFSKAPGFLWTEAISTACFMQNRSLVHTHYNKTLYELLIDKKPNAHYFYVFGSLCYPTNDREDLGKIKPKADRYLYRLF